MTAVKTRRRRGTGTVDLHGGQYRARLPLPDRPVLGHYATEDEAHAILDAALLHLRGGPHDPGIRRALTVGEFAREVWLPDRVLSYPDGDADRNRWNAYVADAPLAKMLLANVRPGRCASSIAGSDPRWAFAPESHSDARRC